MKLLDKIEYVIFQLPLWKLASLLIFVSFLKIGVWYIPNLELSQSIAQNPFVNPFSEPDAHYLFYTWLSPFLAWVMNAKSGLRFLALHFFFSLAFSLLFIRMACSNASPELGRIALILFFSLPVSATSYFWIGPDSVTLFLMLLPFAFPQYIGVAFFSGILLGMQHFEQGLFATTALLIALILSKIQNENFKYSVKFCLFIFLGVIVGKFILMGIFNFYTISLNSGRLFKLQKIYVDGFLEFFLYFQPILWGTLALGWLAVIKYADAGKKAMPFLLTLLGLCLLIPFVRDQTRVFAVISFPLLFVYLLSNADFLGTIAKKEISVLFLLWLILPWGWVFLGKPRSSVFSFDAIYLMHRLFGWFTLPSNVDYWPFF